MVEKISFGEMMKFWLDVDDEKNIIGKFFTDRQIEQCRKKGYFKVLQEAVINAEKKIGTIQFACGKDVLFEVSGKRLLFRGKNGNEVRHILGIMDFISENCDRNLKKDEIKNAEYVFCGNIPPSGTDASCPLF